MILNPGDDGNSLALAHFTSAMGLYWTLYGVAAERLRAALPPALPPCADDRRCPLITLSGTCAAAGVRSVSAEEPFVLVACHARPERSPTDEAMQALAAAFVAHGRAEQDVQATVRELAATYQELAIAYGVMETINLTEPKDALAQELLSHLTTAVPAEGSCLLCVDELDQLQPLATDRISGLDVKHLWRHMRLRAATTPDGQQAFVLPLRGRQVLVYGLRHRERWIGLMALARPNDHPFTSREAKLLQAVGRQAALALRNRNLVEDLRGMFFSTIYALVAAIEVNDAYTCGHSRRVARNARETAGVIGLAPAEVEAVYMAGIVHDIGKIGVEKAILSKKTGLSDTEWETVRTHPDQGAGIIGSVRQLRHLVPGVRHHHERCDGSGYPRGLRDEEIPLESRIIAVCDSYDAMTSVRSYRPALSSEAAVAELRACAGGQFSIPVVEAFLEMLAAMTGETLGKT